MVTIDEILSVLENGTRRSILRQLLLDSTYPLEISKALGISQQAINKHLEVLEKSNMIIFSGNSSSSFGPPRKIYSPTGFSTIVIDYTPGFLEVNHYSLKDLQKEGQEIDDISLDKLHEINGKLNSIMEERKKLVEEKNGILKGLRAYINENIHDELIRAILVEYIETLSIRKVAERFRIDEHTVSMIVSRYII